MSKLVIPNDTANISVLSFHEPMRMTLNGKPIVGMKVGYRDHNTMLIIAKDGSISHLKSISWASQELRFVDYLTEDECFSIFGSAKEREENDIALSDTDYDISDLSNIPDEVPFEVIFHASKRTYRAVLTHLSYGRSMLLIYDNGDKFTTHQYQPIKQISTSGGSWEVTRILPIESIDEFRNHRMRNK